MHIEFLVEELSMEAALGFLVPKILGDAVTFAVHPFGSKHSLLAKLESRLRGYSRSLPPDYRIVVVIDEDRADCRELKAKLEASALAAGLATRSSVRTGRKFRVLNRIAVEELEAWFFGDMAAVSQAFPGVPLNLSSKSGYREPDAIKGGTWEALERALQRAGHQKGGIQKIRTAREVSARMDPARNISKSFQVFRDGLLAMTSA